jgi:hypothetical protein
MVYSLYVRAEEQDRRHMGPETRSGGGEEVSEVPDPPFVEEYMV